MIYDHFTPFVIFALEAYGFCRQAREARSWRAGGFTSTGSCR